MPAGSVRMRPRTDTRRQPQRTRPSSSWYLLLIWLGSSALYARADAPASSDPTRTNGRALSRCTIGRSPAWLLGPGSGHRVLPSLPFISLLLPSIAPAKVHSGGGACRFIGAGDSMKADMD